MQHIILNVQFDDNAKNDDDEIIFMTTYLRNSIRIQRIDRANYLIKMCEQTIFMLNVDQDDRIFQKLTLKIILSEMQSLSKMKLEDEQIFSEDYVCRKERDVVLTYVIL